MSGVDNNQEVEIKFRLEDGSDIGPERFHAFSSIATVKETLLVLWPQEKENAPSCVEEVTLIMEGRILTDSNIVGKCRKSGNSPGVTFMHVLVRPPSTKHKGSKSSNAPTQNDDGCSCLIM